MRVRDEIKEQVVYEKAVELIVNEGLSGFSMQKLAKAAGVSPATLYIYYKDKDDLILKIGIEEGRRMTQATMENFHPDMGFEEGLRQQWKNRSKFWMNNPKTGAFYDQLRHSPFKERIFTGIQNDFAEVMGKFLHNAIKNGDIKPMPTEVFWSVAYGPLMNLVKFHNDGRSFGNMPFALTDEIMEQALQLVIKAFRP